MDKQSLAQTWAASLYTKVDGQHRSEARLCVAASDWVRKLSHNQSGVNYISAEARNGLHFSKGALLGGCGDVACRSFKIINVAL
jgi:hypothetical protein